MRWGRQPSFQAKPSKRLCQSLLCNCLVSATSLAQRLLICIAVEIRDICLSPIQPGRGRQTCRRFSHTCSSHPTGSSRDSMEELQQPQDQPRMQSGACFASAPALAAGPSVTRHYLKARARRPGPAAAAAAASPQPVHSASGGFSPRRPAASTAFRAPAASHTSAPQSPVPHRERERQHQTHCPLSSTKLDKQLTSPQPSTAPFRQRGSVPDPDLEPGRRFQPRCRGLWPRWPLDLSAPVPTAGKFQSPLPPLPPPQTQQMACARGCVWPSASDNAHEWQRRSHPIAAACGPLLELQQPEVMPAAACTAAAGNPSPVWAHPPLVQL